MLYKNMGNRSLVGYSASGIKVVVNPGQIIDDSKLPDVRTARDFVPYTKEMSERDKPSVAPNTNKDIAALLAAVKDLTFRVSELEKVVNAPAAITPEDILKEATNIVVKVEDTPKEEVVEEPKK